MRRSQAPPILLQPLEAENERLTAELGDKISLRSFTIDMGSEVRLQGGEPDGPDLGPETSRGMLGRARRRVAGIARGGSHPLLHLALFGLVVFTLLWLLVACDCL